MPDDRQSETDLVLPLGVHAFILDTTKGNVNVYVGPMKQPLSPKQEIPVIMLPDGRFEKTDSNEKAIKNNYVAAKGQYIVLKNPAHGDKRPKLGSASTMDPDLLQIGETVNLPGPISFAPWPGQIVKVVSGHHLKSNQYLTVRIYDEEAARTNWTRSTIIETPKLDSQKIENKGPETQKPDSQEQGVAEGPPATDSSQEKDIRVSEINPDTLVMGQQLIIKGTEVSFYIPPTGVEVLADEGSTYVKDALTLERLEYCLLVDESGDKRYVQGPQVVFPKPTESFKVNDEGSKKSRAYELNEISGIHVKVIAPYKDSFDALHPEGEELFITGKPGDTEENKAIYFPRVEHAILKYGESTRYHAIAIAPGSARYVMDRLTGKVRLERGPSMFLPDPRREVIVKRSLSAAECATYYPNNEAVAKFNEMLRQQLSRADEVAANTGLPAYRTGHVSIGNLSSSSLASTSSRASDVIERGSIYSPPRTLLLGSGYIDGAAVEVSPWTGYAIQIVDKSGNRRVEVGPCTVQLEFDERLETLNISTGTPKTNDRLLKTSYLRVSNNSISDQFVVTTKDMVRVQLKLKYLVKFTDDRKDVWFSVDDYIKVLVDRFRSRVDGLAKNTTIGDFINDAPEQVAGLLGETGFTFEENGMVVYQIDVLNIEILNAKIKESLIGVQEQLLMDAFDTRKLQSKAEYETFKLGVEVSLTESKFKRDMNAKLLEQDIRQTGLKADHEAREFQVKFDLLIAEGERDESQLVLETAQIKADAIRAEEGALIEFERSRMEMRIEEGDKRAANDESRIKAVQPKLVEAITAMGQVGLMKSIADGFGDLAIVRDQSLSGTVRHLFKDTPLESLVERLNDMHVSTNKDGD